MHDLHGEAALAVADAAGHRRADAGREVGVQEIRVEREVESGGAARGDPDGLSHHGRHPHLVDLAHGEGAHPELAQDAAFTRIEIASADQHGVSRVYDRNPLANGQERSIPSPEDMGQRHSVDVPARRGLLRVAVSVGIDPDHANLFLPPPVIFRHPGNGSDGKRVIPAEDERNPPGLQGAIGFSLHLDRRRHDLR
ncbi:MAG: hypothetical protein QM820_42780 [Minicystis sp.]